MAIPDPIKEGLARGWRVADGATIPLEPPPVFEADVAIVGTGAGGGVAADLLSEAGLSVLLIEEGGLRSSSDFHMKESEAYPALYQETAARKTRDRGVSIMQGRTVGGSTVVNWTSSFRTPPSTLEFWQQHSGLADLTADTLAPWFENMEQRLNIAPWANPPNRHNRLLADGLDRLGLSWSVIPRNVRGCWDIGYCGMGCPTNAKQSMLVTTIPAALDRGAELLFHARAERLVFEGGAVREIVCTAVDGAGGEHAREALRVRARHVVLAGGAINTPALLLRSDAPDPNRLIGRRTFLHPTTVSAAQFAEPVNAFAGAPQSVYSDHFLNVGPIDGPIGFKLEVPPVHPVVLATTLMGLGEEHAAWMRRMRHLHVTIALLRDGFHEEASGGTVRLRDDGSPVLDYPITPFVWDGIRRAMLAMAEVQFAAGAEVVAPFHELGAPVRTMREFEAQVTRLPMRVPQAKVVSAHVMGGCPMSGASTRGVTDSFGRFREAENLSIIDGSLFPTSLGANPQLTIYALAARAATALGRAMTRSGGTNAGSRPG